MAVRSLSDHLLRYNLFGAFVWASALVCLNTSLGVSQDLSRPPHYSLKAAYVFKLLNFADLPGTLHPENQITLCPFVNEVGREYFQVLDRKLIGDRRLKVKFPNISSDVSSCSVLFISHSFWRDYHSQVRRLLQGPYLLFGETSDFCAHGGHINLFFIEEKLRFEINVDAARSQGINFRTNLLKRAKICKSHSP